MPRYTVPNQLLNALIQQESGNNPRALSPKGAYGLGQAMPQTARNPGFGVQPLQSNEPSEQVRFTNDYLEALLNKYNGNVPLALAAYNAGPGNVDKYGDVPPFKETQGYVKNILNAVNPISEAQASEQPYKPTRAEFMAMKRSGQQIPAPAQDKTQVPEQDQTQIQKPTRAEFMAMKLGSKATETEPTYEGRPVSEMSGPSKFLIGAGNAALNIPRAFAQIYDIGDQNKLKQNIQESNTLRDALSKTGAGSAGNIFGNIAPVMMTGGTSLPATLSVGALSGALQTAENTKERVQNIAKSTAAGAIGKGVAAAIPKLGSLSADIIGGIGTHTGGESIKQAVKSGFKGGTKGSSFLENMRGKEPNAIVDDLKAALGGMRSARGGAYRQGMAAINADRTVLDFAPIRKAVDDTLSIGTSSGGHVMNPAAVGIQNQINKAVTEWENGARNIDHTVQGLDELKQTIGNIRDGTDFGTPARKVADDVYNAVKKQIVNQAPEYGVVMKDYELASKLTREIERTLSLGDKAAADTAIRKLLSLTRNNANTNFGNRLNLANNLIDAGAPNAMSDLSGQALNTWTPRGLGFVASGTVGAGAAGHPEVLPLLALQSPRLVGEAAYYTGKAASKLDNRLVRGMLKTPEKKAVAIERTLNNRKKEESK